MRVFFVMFLMLVGASDALAACTFRVTTDQLQQALDDAVGAYAGLDVPGFRKAMTEVDYMVPCLVEVATPELAASLHRVRGIGQYVDGRADQALWSLQTARTLEPSFVFDTEVLPEGFELRKQYEALVPAESPTWPLSRPHRGSLFLDGGESMRRAEDRAVLLQVTMDDAVVDSHYLMPGDPTPPYAGVNGRRSLLYATSAGTGAAAVVLYGAAWASRGSLGNAESEDDLQQIQGRTNLFVGGASAVAVAAGGQLIWALLLNPTKARGVELCVASTCCRPGIKSAATPSSMCSGKVEWRWSTGFATTSSGRSMR